MTTSGSTSGNEWQRVTTNGNEWYSKNISRTTFFAVDDFFSFSLINIPSLISRLLGPSFFRSSHRRCFVTCSSSYNLTPAISRVLIVNTWFFAQPHDEAKSWVSNCYIHNLARKDVLRNFAKFKGKQLRQSLFFNNVAG